MARNRQGPMFTMRECNTQIQLKLHAPLCSQNFICFLGCTVAYHLMITPTIPSASQILLTLAISMVAALLWSRRFIIRPRTRDYCSCNPVPRLQLSADSLLKSGPDLPDRFTAASDFLVEVRSLELGESVNLERLDQDMEDITANMPISTI